MTADAAGPLAGIKIVDLSRILAGPTCTQLLGDLGADIAKVERPGAGDDTRKWGPPYVKDESGRETRESAYYLSANRNKRSLTADLSKAGGQALIRELAAKADVLIENYKVGGLARFGLDYASLNAVNPRLVYCSISGFGQDGPYAALPGYDFLIQAMGGIMSLSGEPDGSPMKVGVGIADVMCGMYAGVAILAALRHRDECGRGQHIDLSLLDTQVAWLINGGLNYLTSGENPVRYGNGHPNIVPYQVFPTSDGFFVLAVGNDEQFRRFCEVGGQPELVVDPRFASNDARVRFREEVVGAVAAMTRTKTSAQWLSQLQAVKVPCGPVNDLAQVFSDPQVRHRKMRISMPHALAAGGSIDLIGNPIKMSETPVTYRRAPPTLGEHTREILAEWLGADEDRIAELRAQELI